jgi:hypothetical protein
MWRSPAAMRFSSASARSMCARVSATMLPNTVAAVIDLLRLWRETGERGVALPRLDGAQADAHPRQILALVAQQIDEQRRLGAPSLGRIHCAHQNRVVVVVARLRARAGDDRRRRAARQRALRAANVRHPLVALGVVGALHHGARRRRVKLDHGEAGSAAPRCRPRSRSSRRRGRTPRPPRTCRP